MDTEAIASEIVYLKNRIAEIDRDVESDREEERSELHERMLQLQDRLVAKGDGDETVGGVATDTVQYMRPV
ncbi:MAG: hypothetical protein WAL25_07145 [Acidimicrobiia bacterium]